MSGSSAAFSNPNKQGSHGARGDRLHAMGRKRSRVKAPDDDADLHRTVGVLGSHLADGLGQRLVLQAMVPGSHNLAALPESLEHGEESGGGVGLAWITGLGSNPSLGNSWGEPDLFGEPFSAGFAREEREIFEGKAATEPFNDRNRRRRRRASRGKRARGRDRHWRWWQRQRVRGRGSAKEEREERTTRRHLEGEQKHGLLERQGFCLQEEVPFFLLQLCKEFEEEANPEHSPANKGEARVASISRRADVCSYPPEWSEAGVGRPVFTRGKAHAGRVGFWVEPHTRKATETLQGSSVQEQRAREKSQGGGYRRPGRADMDDRRDQARGFGTSSLVLCLGNGVDAESGGGGKGFGEACGHQAFTETRHLADPVLQDGPQRKGKGVSRTLQCCGLRECHRWCGWGLALKTLALHKTGKPQDPLFPWWMERRPRRVAWWGTGKSFWMVKWEGAVRGGREPWHTPELGWVSPASLTLAGGDLRQYFAMWKRRCSSSQATQPRQSHRRVESNMWRWQTEIPKVNAKAGEHRKRSPRKRGRLWRSRRRSTIPTCMS